MVTVRVLDHVNHAYTNSDGVLIKNQIERGLEKTEKVTISFEGIDSVSSSFLNSALIDLLEKYDMQTIKSRITFSNSTRLINEAIRRRFSLETEVSGNKNRVPVVH